MIFIKLHRSYRDVVAVCDSNLIGKRFEEGIKQLDATGPFYQGEEHDYNGAVEVLKMQSKEDATFNIMGEDSVKAAIEAGIIKKEGISKVDGIPYALVLL